MFRIGLNLSGIVLRQRQYKENFLYRPLETGIAEEFNLLWGTQLGHHKKSYNESPGMKAKMYKCGPVDPRNLPYHFF